MNLPDRLNSLFRAPRLTGLRMALAMVVAVVADGLQFLLGALGPIDWLFLEPVIDTVAAALITALIGFHILLLPTFIVKLVPVLEELPTWTACTAAVIALRKHEQNNHPPPAPPAPPEKPIIDI
jgi:hypothetical protein